MSKTGSMMRKTQSLTISALLASVLSGLLLTFPSCADVFTFGFTDINSFATGPTVFGQIEGLSVGLDNQAASAVYITSVINTPAGFVSPFTPSENLLGVSLPLSVAANNFSVNAFGNISAANFVVDLGSSPVFVLSFTTANDLLLDFNSGIEIGPGVISFISNQTPPPGISTPEPSTWAMMILGFCGLGYMAYHKKSTLRFA
jgi:hypothetical protein